MTGIPATRLAALAFVGVAIQPAGAIRPEQSIERVATLRTSRSVHTATTLRSGQVLIVGGMTGGGGSLASVELFDPSTNSVREIGPLHERRLAHTATSLRDGTVLIAGGYNGEYLRSIEVFDPSTGRLRDGGSLVEARSGHTATLLADGRVLFVGGVGRGWSFLRSAEIFDPVTGRSEAVGSMRVPRESHTATLLPDGRVLVVAGHSGRRRDMEVYASAEVFVPGALRFEPVGSLSTARHKHDAVRLADGRVLVLGGADRTDHNYFRTTEIYDPGTATFSPGPSMAEGRYKIAGTAVALPSGDVLVTSGAREPELLERSTGAFREVPGDLPDAFRFAAAALLPGGDVVFSGGYSDDNRNTDGIWRYRRP